MSNTLKMVVAGGGTGGHFFPAMAIMEALIKKGVKVKYIGSIYGVESTKFSKDSKDGLLLNIQGFQRQINWYSIIKNLSLPFRFLNSYYTSWKFINSFKPNLVIGTGGYSSALPLLVANHLGIKTIIQEQNSFPGITTRYLSSKVDMIFVSYKNAINHLKKKNIIIAGNPIRKDIIKMDKNEAKRKLNCNVSSPVLAILGGSQGSVPLNNHFKKEFEKYTKSGIQILWQCGKNNYDQLDKIINNDNVHLIPFSDDMGTFYSAADLIISRSGALALSEMTFMGKAMILVPFPSSAGNHQYKNAQEFSMQGAAILLSQKKLASGCMEKIVLDLFNDPLKIEMMEKQSIKMAAPYATDCIVSSIMEIAVS